MTSGQKTTATVGVGLIAVLTLLLSSQSLPVLEFLFGQIRVLAGLPLFGPVVIAAAVGAIAPAWLPHALPASWERHTTKRVTRLMAVSIAFLMVFWRYPNAVGAMYGLFAGSLAYVLYTMGSSLFYRHFPDAEPCSLRPDDPSPR